VPADYGNQKLRCTSYEVMFEVPDAADIFKDKPLYDMDAGMSLDQQQDYLFWLGQDSED